MLKREEMSNSNSCLVRAKSHEMIFVLLARDEAAPHAIREWVRRRCELGKNKIHDEQMQEALECASVMEDQFSGLRRDLDRANV